MSKRKIYRGRGGDEIFNYLAKNGNQVGEILRANGDHVADISLSIAGDDVHLEVDGVGYTSITDALRQRYDDLAIHDADGSDGSGDIANNIIGNYAILRHVIVGSTTLEDIVGPMESSKSGITVKMRVPKAKVTVKILDRSVPAANNLADHFDRDIYVAIARSLGGAQAFQDAIRGLSVEQFSEKFQIAYKEAA